MSKVAWQIAAAVALGVFTMVCLAAALASIQKSARKDLAQEVAPVVASQEGRAVAAEVGVDLRDSIAEAQAPWKDTVAAMRAVIAESERAHSQPSPTIIVNSSVPAAKEPAHETLINVPPIIVSAGVLDAGAASPGELCRVRLQWNPSDPCGAHKGNP